MAGQLGVHQLGGDRQDKGNDDNHHQRKRGHKSANGAPQRPPGVQVGVGAQRVTQLAAEEEVPRQQEEYVHATGDPADEDVEHNHQRDREPAQPVQVDAVGG